MAARKKTRKAAKKSKIWRPTAAEPVKDLTYLFTKKAKKAKKARLAGWRATDAEPVLGWAELTEDIPPALWNVSRSRKHLHSDMKHIKVKIVPVGKRAART